MSDKAMKVKEAIAWASEGLGKALEVELPLDKGVQLAEDVRNLVLKTLCPPRKKQGYRLISRRCYELCCDYAFEVVNGKVVKKKGKCLAQDCPRDKRRKK